MIGYIYDTEEKAIEARDKAAKHKGLPIKEDSNTLYWVDYFYSELDNFWYIKYVEDLDEVLGSPTTITITRSDTY